METKAISEGRKAERTRECDNETAGSRKVIRIFRFPGRKRKGGTMHKMKDRISGTS